jgi:guanylate kinase
MLTIITGKSGAGKSTIVKELEKYGFHPVLTTTTRPKREKEIQNVDYHFVSKEEFLEKIDQNYFAEYKVYKTELGIWYYGSARENIESAGEKDIIILTPEGYRDVVKEYPSLEYRLVYIYANNQTIKNRLMKRGDKKEEADRRLRQDYEDFKGVENLAHRIVYNNENDKLCDVVNKIRKYLEVNFEHAETKTNS